MQTAYLAGWGFPVSEAKVIFLQQVDMVQHLRQKFLTFSVFLQKLNKVKEMNYLAFTTVSHLTGEIATSLSLTSSSHSN